jgi:hypothetical protein
VDGKPDGAGGSRIEIRSHKLHAPRLARIIACFEAATIHVQRGGLVDITFAALEL